MVSQHDGYMLKWFMVGEIGGHLEPYLKSKLIRGVICDKQHTYNEFSNILKD